MAKKPKQAEEVAPESEPAPDAPPDRVTHTMKSMSCVLTQAEQVEAGQELARAIQDYATEESEQEATKREMKSRLAELEAKRNRLAAVVSRGAEIRLVNVTFRTSFANDRYTVVREDTGEVIEDRPLLDDERQVPLPTEA